MARLFTTGFETGTTEWNGAASTGVLAPTFVSTIKRTGAYSCRLGWSSMSPSTFRQVFDANETELFGRFSLYVSSGASIGNFRLIDFRDEYNNRQMAIRYVAGTQTLDIEDGLGTIVALGNVLVPADTWIVVEFHLVIAESGSLIVKINGTTSASFSGDTDYNDTQYVRSIYFGPRPMESIGISVYYVYLDDIAINNTDGSYETSWIGLGGSFWLKPNADGYQNDWTPSTGSDNYALVDEVPPNTTDYVQTLDAADLDLYELEDCPQYIDRILLVQPMHRAAVVTSGSNDLRDVIRVDGTNYEGVTQTVVPVIPSFTLYKGETHYINPDTSAEWQVAEVDALEAGFEIV